MADKRYRVLTTGSVSQRDGEEFYERSAGDEITLTPEAAEHLISTGNAEEIADQAPAVERRRTVRKKIEETE